jgi:hypothetical protein
MLRFIAKWFAKLKYVFSEELAAANNVINADASAYRIKERTKAIQDLNGQADAIEARIKELDEKQEKGYWLCENGHEFDASGYGGDLVKPEIAAAITNGKECETCGKPAKFIKKSEMTGQDLYESEKERKEAVQMADGLRAQAAQQEEMIKTHQEHEKAFRQQAQKTREFAELLRKL